MRGFDPRRGWPLPVLLLVLVLAVVGAVAAAGAAGFSKTTLSPRITPVAATTLSASYELTAADLGGFGSETPKLVSPSAIVETMDTGKVLYERKAYTQRAMASTTKIMTAILVIESGVDLDSTVKVSSKAATTWEVSKWVSAGDKVTVRQLLYALLLRSANGAAVALAENDAGSVSAFIDKMNAKAEELGMEDTHFVTPNGLDAKDHYSTAADMALVARYAMKNDTFRAFVDTKQYTLEIAGHSALTLKNTNKLLQDYSWVNGVKTGSTPNADHCLVSSGTKDGREVVVVVLGSPESSDCFDDSAALLRFGLDQYRPVKLVDQGDALAEAIVPLHEDGRLQLVTDGAFETELAADEVITTEVSIDKTVELPVKAGDVYGHVVFKADGTQVGRVNLVADKSFSRPTLGSKLAYFWHKLVH